MSKIQPLADRVLVKAAAAEEKTVGGIIIPDNSKEKPNHGEVIAVGSGTKDEPMLPTIFYSANGPVPTLSSKARSTR